LIGESVGYALRGAENAAAVLLALPYKLLRN
jgi:hypothetical protein